MLSTAVKFLVVVVVSSIFFLFEMVACKGVILTVVRWHAGKVTERGRGPGRDSGRDSFHSQLQSALS